MAECIIPICFVIFYSIKMNGSGSSFRADEDYLFYRNMRGIMLYAGIVSFDHY